MVSPLLGSLARTINSAFTSIFLDATLTRDVHGTIVDPADPPAPTQVVYRCKAIEDQWASGFFGPSLVNNNETVILILAKSFKTAAGTPIDLEPLALDRIAIRGLTLQIVPMGADGSKAVQTDPARATWLCRCMS